MQPFTISCLTCATKLKVSDESLIGEILRCAKCHSMVLVERPSEAFGETKAAAAATAGAATLAEFDVSPEIEPTPIDVPEPPAVPPVANPIRTAAATEPPLTEPFASAESSAGLQPEATPVEQAAIPNIPAPPVLASQRWILMGAAGAVGMMFVVSIWLFLKLQSAPTLPVADADRKAIVESTVPDPVDLVANPEQESEVPRAEPPRNSTPTKGQPLSADPLDVEQPLQPDPDADAVAVAAEEENPLVLPDTDNGVGKIETPESDQEQNVGEPVDYPIPGPNPDIASRLAMKIEAIEIAGQANQGEVLRNATMLLSQMTSVPIHVDSVALKRLGINDEIPVRAIMENTTATEVLDTMLGHWGLTAIATGDHVVVTLPPNGRIPLSDGYAFPFDDLAADADEMQEMAELIRRMVEPESWGHEDGPAISIKNGRSLTIQQTRLARREILLLSEKLRVARGLVPRSTYYRNNPELLPIKSLSRRAAARLAEPVTLPAVEDVTLANFALGLQHRAAMEFSIDEFALLRAGLSPELVVDCPSQEKKPLVEYLSIVLKSRGLAARVIDAESIQITTPRELSRTPDVEFYLVGETAVGETAVGDGARLIARIESEIEPKYWPLAGSNAAIYYDRPSRCLIVRASQPVQQKLAAVLLKWRGQ